MNVKDLQDILTVLEKGNLLCEVTAASMLRELILKQHESEIDNTVFGVKIIQADVVQPSGFIYPASLLEKVSVELNKRDDVYGETFPPKRGKPILSALNVSHRTYNFRMEGDWLVAELDFINSVQGRILKESVVNAKDVGVLTLSMRNMLTLNGGVVTELHVIGIDALIVTKESK